MRYEGTSLSGIKRQDGWIGSLQVVIAIAVALFLVLPLLVIFPMAFSDAERLTFPPPGYSFELYRKLFSSEPWLSAIAMSFQVGVLAAVIATVFGVPAA